MGVTEDLATVRGALSEKVQEIETVCGHMPKETADKYLRVPRERLAALERVASALSARTEVLGRLLGWDHLDDGADWPYWRAEIEGALGA